MMRVNCPTTWKSAWTCSSMPASQPDDLPDAWIWEPWIKEILGFEARVKEVNERCERYNLVNRYALVNPAKILVSHHHLRTLYEEPDPVGMEEPTNKLLEWLMPRGHGEEDLKLKVVSVLGEEGVGKSTLVKRLWQESSQDKFEFNCRAFVQTAKKPDTRMILRSILSQVHRKQPLKACKVPKLIEDLREHLQHKRYFIVIDGLWDVSVWHIIKRAFPVGKQRIVTTTSVEKVANVCCSYDSNSIINVKCLCDDEAKNLFVDRAFGSEKGCPTQFSDVMDEITRKCGGFPLAIICTARVVARQPEKEQEQQLDYVNKYLPNNLRTHSCSMEILNQVLKLCYSSLPHCLKTCLLYLSVYPENYLFLKEDLVKQWIAEDFICTPEGKDIVDIACSYFDELLSLGLIQRMDINSKKGLLSYTMHPVVFDFITCKSMEDNFITIIDYSQSTVVLSEKVRRLSLQFGSATYATTPESVELSQVRSLSFIGLLGCMPSIAEFKLVRVMILHIFSDDMETRFSLSEVGNLLQLRYLQVRCNVTVELPNKMWCLKHLETLEINAGVEYIPLDIVHLPRLLDIHLGEKTSPNPAVSLVDWNWLPCSSISLQSFMLLPPISILSGLPLWFRQLHKLGRMEIVVRQLSNDIDALAELPVLKHLSLHVQTPPTAAIILSSGMFPALEYFKFACGLPSLSFQKGTLPNLRGLKLVFNAHKRVDLVGIPVGIGHLLSLHKVVASIGLAPGAEESDRIAAESAFLDTVRMHPCHPKFKMKRVGRVGEEYGPAEKQNWGQQKEASERDKVQCETKKGEPFVERDKIPGEMPNDNTKKLVPRWLPQIFDKRIHTSSQHSEKGQKSDVGPSNITSPSFKMAVIGTSEEHKVGSAPPEELIGGMGRELAISCLLRLPRSYYSVVACVNRSFYSLVRSGELYRLRREAGIAEQMIYCSCNVLEWGGFDPCRQRWFSIPSMPPIECFTLCDKESLAVGTNILVFGKRVEAHVLRYSLLTNSWTTGEMMNTPRCLFGSASFGEKAIVAGGFGENGALSSAELYDSEMRTWTTLPSMYRARQMCSGFFMDGKFYVIGGKDERHNEVLSCAEELDLENRTWRLIPDMAQGLNDKSGALPLVAVVNNELYAAVYATKEVRKYDKENNAWITLGLLPDRYTSVHGWGLDFRSCGDMLIVIGSMSAGGSGGLIEIWSWVPNNGPPNWKTMGTRRSRRCVYNCVVMTC